MEYTVYDYISEKYLPVGDQSSWPLINHEVVVIPQSNQGSMKQSRGFVLPGELSGVLEDCPGLILPLGRGDPKKST